MRTKTAGDAFLVGSATALIALAALSPVAAMPRLMDLYNAHPRALPQHRDKCVICHVNADGSGRLTPFGERYEHLGLAFTETLIKEYPNLFASAAPGTAAAPKAGPAGGATPAKAGSGTASPAQAGSAPAAVPAQAPAAPAAPAPSVFAPTGAVPDAEWDPPKYFRAECQKCHGKYGDGDPLQGVPSWANRKWIQERMPQTQELLTILMKGKDKMIGHEGKISEEQGRQLLELVKSIAVQYGS